MLRYVTSYTCPEVVDVAVCTFAMGNLVAMLFVTVVAKFGSSPRAAANSFSVSSVEGAESTRFEMDVSTYCFVTSWSFAVKLVSPVVKYPVPCVVPVMVKVFAEAEDAPMSSTFVSDPFWYVLTSIFACVVLWRFVCILLWMVSVLPL